MIRAKSFEILRGVSANAVAPCVRQPRMKPLRVALILDEDAFQRSGFVIDHQRTLFLDDRVHDWDWQKGLFFYYGHAVAPGEIRDVIVVYEMQTIPMAGEKKTVTPRCQA